MSINKNLLGVEMELTEEQIEFLNKVCSGKWDLNEKGQVDVRGGVSMRGMPLTEIPVKFGRVNGHFDCSYNNLTTLKNIPDIIEGNLYCQRNNLTEYFKSTKEEDFPYWQKLLTEMTLSEYPFLINIMKKCFVVYSVRFFLNKYPLTKIYYKD
jgi:hypothetical protein